MWVGVTRCGWAGWGWQDEGGRGVFGDSRCCLSARQTCVFFSPVSLRECNMRSTLSLCVDSKVTIPSIFVVQCMKLDCLGGDCF